MNKPKQYFFLILFLTPCFEGIAQLRFGLRAGVNAPKIVLAENNYKAIPSSFYTFQAGGVAELNITDMFFVQSGLHFQQKGGAFTIPQQTGSDIDIKTKINYLHLPIEAGIRYYWKENTSILGTLGAFGEYGISTNEKSGKQKSKLYFGDEPHELNPYSLGITGSIGLEFQNTIQLKAHYYYGFTRVYNLPNTSSNHKGLSLTLAYLFGN